MTPAALLTFLGLAVVSVDVFGGMVAAAALGRGAHRRALVALLVTYTAIIVAGILVLDPVLRLAGHLLGSWLSRPSVWSVAQIVVALVLIGVGVHQAIALRRPREKADERPRGFSARALAIAGAVLALTSLVDPPYIASVGLAGQVESVPERIVLLVAWNLIYQGPMYILAIAGLTPLRHRVADGYRRLLERWRTPLLRAVVLALFVVGLAGLAEAALALARAHFPVLHALLA